MTVVEQLSTLGRVQGYDVSADDTNSPGPVPFSASFVLPDSLDDLRGPGTGVVELPRRLLWNPSRSFDLSDEARLRSVIRIALREARSQQDLRDYVDRDSMVRLWPRLGLPDQIRRAWQARFPELLDEQRDMS